MRRLGIVVVALMVAAAPARAIILWEAVGGWNWGGSNSFGDLKQLVNPPAVVTSVGEFSNNGALCPPLGTPEFTCGFFHGSAELEGGVARLHAEARLRQEDATGTGSGKLVYGGARVYFYNVGYETAVSTPVSKAVFNFGLHGTRQEIGDSDSVVVFAQGSASLNADQQRSLQCFGDACEPIEVEVNPATWDPGLPNGTAFIVDLRADVSIGANSGVVFDAFASADYRDTLELLSVVLLDANGDPIPDARLVVRDGSGNVTYTIANVTPATTTTLPGATTTTTLPGATTTTTAAPSTTTTTLDPGSSTTTTLPPVVTTTTTPGATTTTTLPIACAQGASFASVRCRLDELLAAVQAAGAGSATTKLAAKVTAAQQSVVGAEQLVSVSRKQSAKQLRRARKALAAYARVLKSKAARQALDDATRARLGEPLPGLRTDLKALLAP